MCICKLHIEAFRLNRISLNVCAFLEGHMDLECLSFERREAALLFSSVPFSVVWLSVFPGYRILCIPGSYAAGCALVVALLKASCWSCHLLITGFCLPTVLTQLEVFLSTVKSPQHTRCNYCRAHQAI